MRKVNADRLIKKDAAAGMREEILGRILDSIKHVEAVEGGYTLRFGSTDEDYVLVADWVQIERLCNPFLRFTINVESSQGPITVAMQGPSGTAAFLEQSLSLGRWMNS